MIRIAEGNLQFESFPWELKTSPLVITRESAPPFASQVHAIQNFCTTDEWQFWRMLLGSSAPSPKSAKGRSLRPTPKAETRHSLRLRSINPLFEKAAIRQHVAASNAANSTYEPIFDDQAARPFAGAAKYAERARLKPTSQVAQKDRDAAPQLRKSVLNPTIIADWETVLIRRSHSPQYLSNNLCWQAQLKHILSKWLSSILRSRDISLRWPSVQKPGFISF